MAARPGLMSIRSPTWRDLGSPARLNFSLLSCIRRSASGVVVTDQPVVPTRTFEGGSPWQRSRAMTPYSTSPCGSPTCPLCSASEHVLVDCLRSLLTVAYVPRTDLVAVLDTTTAAWVLNLDSGSSADDRCWALLDVFKVLALGADAADSARSVPTLSPLRKPDCTRPTSSAGSCRGVRPPLPTERRSWAIRASTRAGRRTARGHYRPRFGSRRRLLGPE